MTAKERAKSFENIKGYCVILYTKTPLKVGFDIAKITSL